MNYFNRLAIGFCLTALFFTVLLVFFKPLLNSGDDAFVMYTFSGAFGVDPSALVDYNHVWHYWLGLFVTELFVLFRYFNWYTGFLLSLHFLSCIVIFSVFLKKLNLWKAILFFLLFFLFFEARYLLSLSFTNSSIILALAGNLLLVDRLSIADIRYKDYVIGFCILAISGLLRFHALGFVEFFFLFFVSFLFKKERLKYFLFKGVLFGFLIISFLFHTNYYQKHIHGWAYEESKRQVLYQLYNKAGKSIPDSKLFKDEVEKEFFATGFSYDTSIIDKERSKTLVRGLLRNRSMSVQEDREMLYWIFMESRVYIFLFLILFVLARKQKNTIKYFAISLCATLLLFLFLFVYRKITGYMFITFFSANFLLYILLISQGSFPKYSFKERGLLYALVCTIAFWMGIRTFKINQQNIANYNRWKSSFSNLRQHPSLIFISSNHNFPIDYFAVTDVPEKMIISNYISAGQFPTTLYNRKLKQFHLNNVMNDILNKKNVVLIGAKLKSLKEYYKNKNNIEVELVELPQVNNCQTVIKVVPKS